MSSFQLAYIPDSTFCFILDRSMGFWMMLEYPGAYHSTIMPATTPRESITSSYCTPRLGYRRLMPRQQMGCLVLTYGR